MLTIVCHKRLCGTQIMTSSPVLHMRTNGTLIFHGVVSCVLFLPARRLVAGLLEFRNLMLLARTCKERMLAFHANNVVWHKSWELGTSTYLGHMLMLAAKHGKTTVLESLVRVHRCRQLLQVDETAATALHWATRRRNKPAVDVLIEAGANVNHKDCEDE